MTDRPTEPVDTTSVGRPPDTTPDPGSARPGYVPGTTSAREAGDAPGQVRPPTFEERMQSFGREAEAAGERFGRQAQAAGERLQRNPTVVGAADTAARAWGLILLAVGLWFFADVTLGMDMPSIPWRDVWPLALIVIGVAVIFRGMARRSA